MSWTDMSWADMSQEDAAEGDAVSTAGIILDSTGLSVAATDPDIAVPVDGLDPATALGFTPTAIVVNTSVTATPVPAPAALLP